MTNDVDYSGETLDERYVLVRLLGRGGMGAVYEGRHLVVGKRVAVKLLHAEFATDGDVLKRFYREAQTAAAIGHRNIIDIMDVGVTSRNEPYMVMEYLEGEDLDSMLTRTGPVSIETACGVLEPALLALGAAHEKGVVHRDLKPANIFLVRNESGPPTVKLIDFGISKMAQPKDSTRLTRTGTLLGTPAYMSPEQAKGMSVDHRTDIYAMGVILYEMLTGYLPFRGDNYNMLLVSIMHDEPQSLRQTHPGVPPEVDALVRRQLSKDPADRCQSAQEMLNELKKLQAFNNRESGMFMLATQIRTEVAGGDIGGSEKPSEGSSASSVLADLIKSRSGEWTGTKITRVRKPILISIAAAVLIGGAVAFALMGVGGDRMEPAVVPMPAVSPSPETEGVQIDVRHVPEGGRILYDGAPVPMNPFRVKKGATIVPLRVEADGMEPFVISVIPEKNLTVEAVWKPLLNEEPVSADPAVQPVRKPSRPTRADGGKKAATGSTIREDRRGAMISEEFE